MYFSVIDTLQQIFISAAAPWYPDSAEFIEIKETKYAIHGDFQLNGIMQLAKQYQLNPVIVAQQLISQINCPHIIAKLEIANPCFINITLESSYIAEQLTPALLQMSCPQKKIIVIDYSSPNLAKALHVGHLRSMIIGDAIANIQQRLGHIVIKQNHVGDWGMQFGMLLAALAGQTNISTLSIADLEILYKQAKYDFDHDTVFAAQSRECLRQLQAHDATQLALWQQLVAISIAHCQSIYETLGISLTLQHIMGESSYNDKLSALVTQLCAAGIAIVSNGAICIFLDDQIENTPFIIQKQDGAYLYATTDLAAIKYRVETLHADTLLYIVDARQRLHLQQLFAVSRTTKLVSEDTVLEHVAFGVVQGENGQPFKTREGENVKLAALISAAITQATEIIASRNPQWTNVQITYLAHNLAVSALKYADLMRNRLSDYRFNLAKMLSFSGNTAPYLLYSYTRIISIFKKITAERDSYLVRTISINNIAERSLALQLIKYPDTLYIAANSNFPHYLCNYLYQLAVTFNAFYETQPIINPNDIVIMDSRLALAAYTATVLQDGLAILGIATVESM